MNDNHHERTAEVASALVGATKAELRQVLALVAGHLMSVDGKAEAVLARLARMAKADPAPLAERIVTEVAAEHGVLVSEILGRSRCAKYVRARQAAMFRLRDETMLSYPAIARRLRRTDHTTAIHGVRRHGERTANGYA